MKRSNVLTSQRTFERRVKARLEEIRMCEEGEVHMEVEYQNAEATSSVNPDSAECRFFSEDEDEICSSDCDSEDEYNVECAPEFIEESVIEGRLEIKLWRWAIQRKITLSALSELLKMLQPYVNESLPTDARTLLNTPSKVAIEKVGSGKFWQSGLTPNLLLLIQHKKCPKTLKLMVSIDGVKPYKSSVEEFWPIQCAVDRVEMEPFFVRIWYGEGKPPLEDFLQPFVDELLSLLENRLVTETGEVFEVEVYLFICDAPARAYVKCIKGHSGYFSCERCTTEGEYLSDHVCLVETNASLRTDSSFRSKEQIEHHKGTSPLEQLPINMVHVFSLDYLHLVLLGVMKTLITFWIKGTATYLTKFSASDISLISMKILSGRKCQPSDINRRCRALSCFCFWKATEFRTMLLKIGPAVLKGHLTAEAYNHFLSLHCAITILTSKTLLHHTNVAKVLLMEFVTRFDEIYGNERLTPNIHSLIHLDDDVEKYGPLDLHSAFRYETNLGVLKSLIRSGNLPLEQVAKRLLERQYMKWTLPNNPHAAKEFPYLSMPKTTSSLLTYRKLCFENTQLDCSDRNCWILTKAENIVKVEYFSNGNNGILVHGRILNENSKSDFYEKPLASSILSIYECTTDTHTPLILNISQFKCKLYRIPTSGNKSAFFPLFHTEK